MYTLKSIVRRSVTLGMAVALFAATIVPTASVFADELNPLTERSLTLTSGSPGWAFTDGSGNSTYAPPNSGANGQKTGNTFSFKVSSAATVRAFSFQYCTFPAGDCMGPGDNELASGDAGAGTAVRKTNAQSIADGDNKSDLEVVTDGNQSQIEQASLGSYVNTSTGAVTAVPTPASTGLNYLVMYNNGGTWTSSDDWTMTASELQYGAEEDGESTGKNNYITLTNSTGQALSAGQQVKIVFFGTNSNYITNPGSEEFFVKINTYNSHNSLIEANKIDGGVTVANVMNESIQITTKVLETMDFSVGTVDPYTLAATATMNGSSQLFLANGKERHGPCEAILTGMTPASDVNTLNLGNELGEFSLETDDTYSTHSYWRLSSNSSAGATVYYSGVTLSNTVGDKIDAINGGTGNAAPPSVGSEQFGLALANGNTGDPHLVDYTVERGSNGVNFEGGADNLAAGIVAGTGIHASVTDPSISNLTANASYHSPRLTTMDPVAAYADGAGVVNENYTSVDLPNDPHAIDTSFAFTEASNTIPVAIATENTDVINCVTGKMRYIANIAATTPAGIYTTKINYIAAPQY